MRYSSRGKMQGGAGIGNCETVWSTGRLPGTEKKRHASENGSRLDAKDT